ncbi:methyltransferase-like protein 1, partial [Jimgerdemannia flammicorona]
PAHPSQYDWSRHYPAFFPPTQEEDAKNEPSGSIDIMNERTEAGKKVEFADIGCGYGGLLIALAPLFPQTLMLGMEIRVKVEAYVDERIKALRIHQPGQYQNVSIIRMNAMKFLPNFFEKAQTLLAEYAYVLRVGGILYTITDVKDLHEWMAADPVVTHVREATEEGKKVARNQGQKYLACYYRVEDPQEQQTNA